MSSPVASWRSSTKYWNTTLKMQLMEYVSSIDLVFQIFHLMCSIERVAGQTASRTVFSIPFYALATDFVSG